MIFTNTFTLILALAPATLFAAPTKTVGSLANLIARRGVSEDIIKTVEDGVCDLSLAVMPTAPTPLPPPAAGLTLAHVAIGRGTQNYTCASADAKPVANGAMATLFNATCSTVRAPVILSDLTKYALKYPVPTSEIATQMQSGHHEFNVDKAPFFSLDTDLHKYGTVNAKLVANSTAPATASEGPNGLGSVPWLKLIGKDGDYKEIYRLDTAGGVAPKTCEGMGSEFTIQYVATYWFWK
ncbi:hypothetical protein CC78DRAFT_532586 [Lojkania enalia]|uniref:Malate dehydrogenase n=1 Tax=Lojkania enalia TaxID=147567 RepID=A0A9P4KAM0_9PLEO|nr:hypothetical protein CC78DRAFT_532586 [Didymosphaeria enalia]